MPPPLFFLPRFCLCSPKVAKLARALPLFVLDSTRLVSFICVPLTLSIASSVCTGSILFSTSPESCSRASSRGRTRLRACISTPTAFSRNRHYYCPAPLLFLLPSFATAAAASTTTTTDTVASQVQLFQLYQFSIVLIIIIIITSNQAPAPGEKKMKN